MMPSPLALALIRASTASPLHVRDLKTRAEAQRKQPIHLEQDALLKHLDHLCAAGLLASHRGQEFSVTPKGVALCQNWKPR